MFNLINSITFTEKEQAILLIGFVFMSIFIFYKLRNAYYKKMKYCPKCGNKLIIQEKMGMFETIKYKFCFKCSWSKEIH